MLGFLSEKNDAAAKVTKDRISFVSFPNTASKDEIKMLIAPKAKLFADTLNLYEVYLHFGKETIVYDYKV